MAENRESKEEGKMYDSTDSEEEVYHIRPTRSGRVKFNTIPQIPKQVEDLKPKPHPYDTRRAINVCAKKVMIDTDFEDSYWPESKSTKKRKKPVKKNSKKATTKSTNTSEKRAAALLTKHCKVLEGEKGEDDIPKILGCHCGATENDGNLVQCTICFYWQHATCNNFESKSDVPENYSCVLCREPHNARESMSHKQAQEWLLEGKLPTASYHSKNPELEDRFKFLKKTHNLVGNLIEIKRSLHSLEVKTNIASTPGHHKLYLWSKKWETDTTPLSTEPSTSKSAQNIPIIPEPEERIVDEVCQQNLWEHISKEQDSIMNMLDTIEDQVEELEAEELAADPDCYEISDNEEIFSNFLKDLETLKKIAEINEINNAKEQ